MATIPSPIAAIMSKSMVTMEMILSATVATALRLMAVMATTPSSIAAMMFQSLAATVTISFRTILTLLVVNLPISTI